MEKICTQCKTQKPVQMFNKHPGFKDGHRSKCKECTRANHIEYRNSNRDDINARRRLVSKTTDYKLKRSRLQNTKDFKEKQKQFNAKRYKDPAYKASCLFRSAKRRSALIQATPSWADLTKIKNIYENCPAGHHVDHIIPLQGENICGLHIETNLQYLKAEDNLRKKNKFEVTNG